MRGVTYKFGREVRTNPPRPLGDIEEIPPLDYGLLPEGFVRNMGVSIVASRGCAFKCAYCNESRFWGQKVRRVSVERVVEEIKGLAEKYDNYAVGLEDSMFNMRSPYFFELMERLKPLKLNPGFYLLSRVDSITEEGLKAMKAAGVNNLVLGIESMSPRVLKMMGKRIDPGKILSSLRMARRHGLIVGTFWIIGHPGDSPSEAERSLRAMDYLYGEELIQTSEVALFVPYPGTSIFERPDEFGVEILTYEWDRWGRFNTEPVCQLRDFSKEEIMEAWKKASMIVEKWKIRRTLGIDTQRSIWPVAEETVFSGVGRNSPCPCGSGKKFKRCCGAQKERKVL